MNQEESLILLITLVAFMIPLNLNNNDYNSLYVFFSLFLLVGTCIFYSVKFFTAPKAELRSIFYFMFFMFLIIIYFALLYKTFGIIDSTVTIENNTPTIILDLSWLNAIYFSVVTWTTLGFGDYRPHDSIKYLVIIESMIGYIFMSLLTGKFLYFFQKYTSQENN